MPLYGIRGSCVPEGSLGSLFTERWGCDPTWVVVCPGASQQLTEDGARFSQNGHLQRKAAAEYLQSFAFYVLPSQQATFTPVFPGCPPKLQSGLTQIPMETALPWDPVRMKVCVRLLRMGSLFPPIPWSSCAQAPPAFNARCSRALSPSARSQHVRV